VNPDRLLVMPNRSPESVARRQEANREWYRENLARVLEKRKQRRRAAGIPAWGTAELSAQKAAILAERNRARARPADERFWPKVEKTGTCWLWGGARDRGGYGVFENQKAHRVSYVLSGGTIPEGLQLDHLCFVRHCVNPEHLEPVTAKENTRRARARTA
jgi:hypothetical protein